MTARAKFDTYLHLGRTSARKLLNQGRPEPSPPGVWVEALTGFHTGYAAMPAATGEFTISGCEGADVFLLDDVFQDITARVFTEVSVVGTLVRVLVDGHGFRLGDQALVSGQMSDPERLPVDLRNAGVSIRLSPVEGDLTISSASLALPAPMRPPLSAKVRPRYHLRVGLAAAMGALILGAGWLIDSRLTGPAAGGMVITTATAAAPLVIAAEQETAEIEPLTFADRIARTDLADHLVVTTLSDGTERVEGDLPPGLMPLWRDVHTAYDAGTARPTVVRVRALPDLSAFPAIAVVRHGDDPIIFFASGSTARPGDVVEGWTLRDIAQGSLTLTRSGESRTLTY